MQKIRNLLYFFFLINTLDCYKLNCYNQWTPMTHWKVVSCDSGTCVKVKTPYGNYRYCIEEKKTEECIHNVPEEHCCGIVGKNL